MGRCGWWVFRGECLGAWSRTCSQQTATVSASDWATTVGPTTGLSKSSAGAPGPKCSSTSHAPSNNPASQLPVELAQHRAIRYTERLAEADVVASVGSERNSYDNAMAEALNSFFKAGCIRNPATRPICGWKAVADFEIAVSEYVDLFNHRRLPGEPGLVPPAEYEATYWASQLDQHYRMNPVLTEAGTN